MFNGLNRIDSSVINVRGSDWAFPQLNSKFPLSQSAASRVKAAFGAGSIGTKLQSDARAFATLGAETGLRSHEFSDDLDEFDLEIPSEGFSSIADAIEDIRNGKVVLPLSHTHLGYSFSFLLLTDISFSDGCGCR